MGQTTLRATLAAGCALVLLGATPIPATPRGAASGAPPTASTRDFRIETDQTNSNLNNGDFTMPHRVKFFRPGTDIVGDSAKGNFKAGTVTITGHVVLHDNGQSGQTRLAGPGSGAGPATLSCDELQVDSKRKIYIATGNVHYVQGPRHAVAQSGKLDQGAHTLDLAGDVQLGDGEQTLTAQTVHYDTLTKDVNTSGNPVIFTQPASRGLPGLGSTLPVPGTRSTLPVPGGRSTQLPPDGRSTLPTPAAPSPPGSSAQPSPTAKATSGPK